jgi:hypothetical protein
VKLAAVPANRTALVPVKFVPPIVTLAPTAPLAGVTLVIVGGAKVRFKKAFRTFAVVCWIRESTRE